MYSFNFGKQMLYKFEYLEGTQYSNIVIVNILQQVSIIIYTALVKYNLVFNLETYIKFRTLIYDN